MIAVDDTFDLLARVAGMPLIAPRVIVEPTSRSFATVMRFAAALVARGHVLLISQDLPSTSRARSSPLLFHHRAQPLQSLVPLIRNEVERAARFLQLLRSELPQPFAALAKIPYETCIGEHIQMFGHGLPRDLGTLGELSDRYRPCSGQARDDVQACRVAEGREDWRGTLEKGTSGTR